MTNQPTALRGGYWGKILWVDLSTSKTWVETFDEDFARTYLGGVGFAAKIVADHVTAETDPLGPENVLVVATGPFQAAKIAGAGRFAVGAKSPLTGYWGEANGGAHAGPALKRAGFDAIAITGQAAQPTYLVIEDGRAKLQDASALWGQVDAAETVDALKAEHGKKSSVLAIGQAAERLVRYGVIANDKHGFCGRSGMGSVMGAKRLKAIVLRGTLTPPIADPEGLQATYQPLLQKILAAPFTASNREHGMPGGLVWRESNASLPMKNWQQGSWPEGAPKIGAPVYTDELGAKPWPCDFCVMGCHRKLTNADYAPYLATGGPEYESLAMLGANLLIDDLEALVTANDLCNRYGMDTIELGGVFGWAFDAYDRGHVTTEDTDGLELTWGNAEAMLALVEKVAQREGFGHLLGEGLRACVAAYPETAESAVEVMGQAVAAHDPRAFFAQTITTIASTRGACHLHGFAEAVELGGVLPELGITEPSDRFDPHRKGYYGAIYQDIQQFWNALVFCMFYFSSEVSLTDQTNLLNHITGWDTTPEEAQQIGERIVALQHTFNLRMGLNPAEENVMPARLTRPLAEGGTAGHVPPWEEIRAEYWTTKEWPEGIPTEEKLAALGLTP